MIHIINNIRKVECIEAYHLQHSDIIADRGVFLNVYQQFEKISTIGLSSVEISDKIGQEVKRGVTGLYGKGMYSNKDKLILICAASRSDISKIKNIAKDIDERCFIVVANAREVLGEGFKK